MLNKVILLAMLCSLLTSCYTKQQAIRKFCRQDTVTATILVSVHDTIELSPDSSLFTVSGSLLQYGLDSLTKLYEDSLQSVWAVKDKVTGYVSFKVIDKPRTIISEKKVPVKIKLPCNCPPCPGPTFIQKVFDWIEHSLAFLGILAILYLSFRVLRQTTKFVSS